MIDPYLAIKWLHIISATVLFGFGAGTAFYLWTAHLTRTPPIIAHVARMVVRADWIFTLGSGLAQPATGFALIYLGGFDPFEPWLVATYVLYAVALGCWVPVVALQIRAHRLAEQAARDGDNLGDDYHQVMRRWFILGWPAFIGLLIVFWLMVAKPSFV